MPYRDGQDSVPWHGDPFSTPQPCDSMVALIVLGPPRPFLLRARGGGRYCGTIWATAI
jgi:hypothetical protein